MKPFGDAFAENEGGFFMPGLHGQVEGGLAGFAGQVQVSTAVEQDADHCLVAVLRGGMEWGESVLFADIWVGVMLEQHFDDLAVSAGCRRLNGRGAEIVAGLRV